MLTATFAEGSGAEGADTGFGDAARVRLEPPVAEEEAAAAAGLVRVVSKRFFAAAGRDLAAPVPRPFFAGAASPSWELVVLEGFDLSHVPMTI